MIIYLNINVNSNYIMKLECSLDLKNCSCDRNFCRKSTRIHPIPEDHNIPYHKTQIASISKHNDKNGAYLLCILLCIGTSCILAPICGLWIGPLIYYIQLASGQLPPTTPPTFPPTFSATFSPTVSPTSFILELLHETIYNVSNITI